MNTAQLFRQVIAKQIVQKTSCSEALALQLLGIPKATKQQQFGIPLPKLLPHITNATQICQEVAQTFECHSYITQATAKGPFLHFDVSLPEYVRHTLNSVYQQQGDYGTQQKPANAPTIVIDYSSPNIAKPFHAGHLRSTILGNFIKRSHEAMGYRAIGINYLGDWGKQYGLLAVGFEKYGNEEELLKDPIHHLYNVYVAINKEAATDVEIDRSANQYFKRMEQGDEEALSQWRRFREISIDCYRTIYRRLNIEFDQYSGESQTEGYIERVYDILRRKKLLTETEGGLCVDLEKYNLGKPIVQRADGTTLYMTRDLAGLIMRTDLYSFNKAVYVVGTEQSLYLQQLFKIWHLINDSDTHHQLLEHANFGRIQGMSTRKGTVIFLQDILDTAKERMMENMQESASKYKELMEEGVPVENGSRVLKGQMAADYVADKLGTSAVIIQDFLAKRIKNYTFSWDRMTAARGYTGVYLQFTYARLCGIERKAAIPVRMDCDTRLLLESDAAIDLVLTISQYPDILQQACRAMEPSTLVQYLFRLSHSISQATTSLRVKDVADTNVAQSRMLLFWSAKTTLANGLKMLGIDPLERI